MARTPHRTVSQVADLAGVTVRTLHHYDAIGLLVPSERSHAGYRLYTHADLERLQAILFYRELDLPLDEIRGLLDDPRADREQVLLDQRARLTERADRLGHLVKAIDAALDAHSRGTTMSDDALFEVFDETSPDEHRARATEAEREWGETDAWQQSANRTKNYGTAEWQAIKDEVASINERLAALLRDGVPATDERPRAIVEEHRQHITRWFYDCPLPMHGGLADMYVADDRFRATYDEIEDGLAQYVHDAIKANVAAG